MTIKIYDDIVLFGKEIERYDFNLKHLVKSDLLDFYVSDENNQNTLATGRNWASRYNYKDQDKVIEIHTENKGFKLSLDSSADNSSQGGKLSFWMCRIDKDNIHGRIGINQKELNELFKESTFINGVCQQEVCFYRVNGNVGACVVGGERYKQFYSQQNNDENIRKASKTTKWEQGRIYKTLTTSEVWLCDIINILDGDKGHLVINDCEEYHNIKELIDDIRTYKLNTVDKFKSKTATDKVFDLSDIKELFYNKHKELILKEIKTILKTIDEKRSYYYSSSIYKFGYCIDKNMFPMAEYKDMLIAKYYYLSYIANTTASNQEAIYDIVEYLEILDCDYDVDNDDIERIKKKYKYE